MTLTSEILAAVVVLLVLYDIWTALRRGLASTISWTSYQLAKRYPVIPLGIGVVIGHIFWPNTIG